jgi:hypothetical protein
MAVKQYQGSQFALPRAKLLHQKTSKNSRPKKTALYYSCTSKRNRRNRKTVSRKRFLEKFRKSW